MRHFKQALSSDSIHKIIGGELYTKKDVSLNCVSDPKQANENSVIFLDNDKFLSFVLETQAGLIIANSKFKQALENITTNLLLVDNAYQSILILIHFWLKSEEGEFVTNIHHTAVINPKVKLPENVIIGAYTYIDEDVKLGEYTKIDAFCSIGAKTQIGEHCHIYPHVTMYPDTIVGDNVYIHSGSVIGADGFGYLLMNGLQQKIPQIGQVIINNNVEIGANTTIDRGTISPTIIGEGTKIDNLVQIGHNCVIGKHCILCAQVGLAGSTILGDYVYLAGQVGLAGHLTIGDGAMVGAQSGVASDLEKGGKYFGYPAREAMQMKKIMAAENSLPEMYRFYKKKKKEEEQE